MSRILTHGGRAAGVELHDGEVIEADVVLSNADPKRTFLKLLDEADLDSEIVNQVRALKTQSASAKFLCALRELPDFSSHLGDGYDPEHLAMISLCPTVEHPERSWNDAQERAGLPTRRSCRSRYQPCTTRRSPRRAATYCRCGSSSCRPTSGTAHGQRCASRFGERLIDEVCKYAPNFRDAIIDWTLLTPEDIEERIGLTDGQHQAYRHHSAADDVARPLPGWSDYRPPVEGLYLCGAGTHPGGEVTGAPGHNAAHVVLEELGR